MTTKRRAHNPMAKLVAYWRDHWRDTFPGLPVEVIGWGEPFCFRCGWFAPMPDSGDWSKARGWLERAHLHDFSGDGPDVPSNIVPLCLLCHRQMPDFPDDQMSAIAWVSAQGHRCCPVDWQAFTERTWGGEMWQASPGRLVVINRYLRWTEQTATALQACDAATAGDIATAIHLAEKAGAPRLRAQEIFARHAAERALEMAA